MSNIFDLFKKIEKQSGQAENISFIIAGLGNPGKEYANTRHNIGFRTLDYIQEKEGFSVDRLKFDALVHDGMFAGKRCLFMCPQTFMNNSGTAVSKAASFYKIPPENILIIYDDISLEPGRLRIRKKGSDGGHNGIKSIISCIGSENFPRIKIGVGAKPSPDTDLASWVLGNFSADDKDKMKDVFEKAYDAAKLIVSGDIDVAANKYN